MVHNVEILLDKFISNKILVIGKTKTRRVRSHEKHFTLPGATTTIKNIFLRSIARRFYTLVRQSISLIF